MIYISEGNQTAVIRVDEWEEARLIGNYLQRWIFRGHENAGWVLKSSLERAFETRGIPLSNQYPIEQMMLIEFKQSAHLFSNLLPYSENIIAWLLLMRHYGAATRVLDFTNSFYIAAYFALEKAATECAIWAYDRKHSMSSIEYRLDTICEKYQINQSLYAGRKINAIMSMAVNGKIDEEDILITGASEINERQFLQQGLVMFPLSISNSLMNIVLNSFQSPAQMPTENNFKKYDLSSAYDILNQTKLVKLIIDKKAFLEARTDLEQMNIHGASLFRGLEGLGKKALDVLNTLETHLNEKSKSQ